MIYSTAELIIIGSTFTKNQVTTGTCRGGAVYSTGALTITDSTFTENTALNNGGAVCSLAPAQTTIKDSIFKENKGAMGGAVLISGDTSCPTCTIENCSFDKNESSSTGGGLNFYQAQGIVIDCRFSNNTAATGDGAIQAGSNLTLYGTSVDKAFFTNNEVTSTTGTGGAVKETAGTLRGNGYLFENNTPEAISAKASAYNEYSVASSTELRTAVANAKALNTEYAVCIKVTNSFEFANDIEIPTGCNIVLLNEGGTKDAPVTIYRKSTSTQNGMFNIKQGATLTLRGVGEQGTFILDGRTQAEIEANTSIEDATGQARSLITNAGNLTIDNLKMQYVKKNANAGAVINNTDGTMLTIRNSVFDHNNTSTLGSVLYNKKEVSIIGSSFTNNKSGSQGGAIYNDGGTCQFTDSEFKDNSSQHGGALRNAGGTMVITDCRFDGNTATNMGGAIYNNKFLTLQGTDVTKAFFKNNQATEGGAIYNGGTLRGSGYLFENNTPAIGTPIGVESAENAVNLYRQ